MKIKISSIFFLLVLFFSFSFASLAQVGKPDSLKNEVLEQMHKTGQIGYPTPGVKTNLPKMIGQIISIALSFIGLIFFILLVYGGFLWMTAGGNEEQVGKAKKIIKNGVIGLILALSAYAISYFITSKLEEISYEEEGILEQQSPPEQEQEGILDIR